MSGSPSRPAEERHSLLAADIIRVRLEHLILQNGAVAAENDFAFGGVLADQGDRLLHLVHDRHEERDADVIVALLQLLDQFALGRVLQHHRGRVEVLRDIIEGEMDVDGARAEKPLGARDLPVKQFITDRRRVPVFWPHGTAHTGKKDLHRNDSLSPWTSIEHRREPGRQPEK